MHWLHLSPADRLHRYRVAMNMRRQACTSCSFRSFRLVYSSATSPPSHLSAPMERRTRRLLILIPNLGEESGESAIMSRTTSEKGPKSSFSQPQRQRAATLRWRRRTTRTSQTSRGTHFDLRAATRSQPPISCRSNTAASTAHSLEWGIDVFSIDPARFGHAACRRACSHCGEPRTSGTRPEAQC